MQFGQCGNILLTCSCEEAATKTQKRCYGLMTDQNDGHTHVWLDRHIQVPEKFVEAAVHEFLHVVESAYGLKLPHKLVNLLSSGLVQILTSSGMVDAEAFKAKYLELFRTCTSPVEKKPEGEAEDGV